MIVPTIGRPQLLARCLASVVACRPQAAEVLVIDQSADRSAEAVVAALPGESVRVIATGADGLSAALNRGFGEARHDTVLVTHDDCTVARDWVAQAESDLRRSPGAVVTGMVLPDGDARLVPSTITDPDPVDYTGRLRCGVLWGNNFAAPRAGVLLLGGFDPRIPAAEDNDFCYRWLLSGLPLRYAPVMKVWHHDWRTPQELEDLYRRYAFSQGLFYAKHLARGDLNMLRFLAADGVLWARSVASRLVRSRPRHTDPRRALFPGVLRGMGAWRGCRKGWA